MSPSRKTRIQRAFDRAEDYASHARIQRTVADRLADRILRLDIDGDAPALEIGCGTGFLTQALLDSRPGLPLTASDIAPAMLDRTRHTLGERDTVRYALLDGERLAVAPGSFGLIASSLAFQWFEDPVASVSHMIDALRPNGLIAFSTLVSGSFAEWAHAQQEAGLDNLTRVYPEPSVFAGIAPGRCTIELNRYNLSQAHPDGMAFLRSLKAIGADARWGAGGPSPIGALRKAITIFERQGATITYEIAEVVIRKNEPEGL